MSADERPVQLSSHCFVRPAEVVKIEVLDYPPGTRVEIADGRGYVVPLPRSEVLELLGFDTLPQTPGDPR